TLKGHSTEVSSVAFSPDGETIATGSGDNTVKLWNEAGEELQTLKGHSAVVSSVAFSPDGETIATGSRDNTVKLWNEAGEELQTLKGHSTVVSSVAFSPDGETIATGSWDNTVKLWNFRLDDLITKGCTWLDTYFVRQSPDLLMELEVCQQQNPTWLIEAAAYIGKELASGEHSDDADEKFNQARNLVAQWSKYEDVEPYKDQYPDWIEALEQGENPFTAEVLEMLKGE
ncbi:MAG: WD40 repeat domain-containing protein, partial [Cyanobacteria bacterium J06635_1]